MADINVYGTLKSKAGDGKVALASQIYDELKGKFQSEINEETDNEGLVSAKVAQSFTDSEKEQVRQNIGTDNAPVLNSHNLVKSGGVKAAINYAYDNSVGIREQNFSDKQKAQARENIGAGDLQSITKAEFDEIFND